MKRFKNKELEFTGQFDNDTDRSAKRSKKSKRPVREDEEMEFQSWMNRPSDVRDYLEEDLD